MIAAYAVTATVLVGYTVSLLFLLAAEAGREQARSDTGLVSAPGRALVPRSGWFAALALALAGGALFFLSAGASARTWSTTGGRRSSIGRGAVPSVPR